MPDVILPKEDQDIIDDLVSREFPIFDYVTGPQIACMRRMDWQGKRVVEFGAWDGRHSEIAMKLGAAGSIAIEQHERHWNCPTSHSHGISVVHDDVERVPDAHFIGADVIIACGILYHLRDPSAFLRRISHSIAKQMFMWTHVAKAPLCEHDGYAGDVRSDTGGEPFETFYFTLESLIRCLDDCGWKVDMLEHTMTAYPITPSYSLVLNR